MSPIRKNAIREIVMRDMDFYIEKAQLNSNYKSDRMLSLALGKNPNLINYYKRKGVLPSDETMLKLAEIAGVDAWIALLDLNMLRTSGETRSQYADIMKKIESVALAVLVTATLGFSASPAIAKTATSKSVTMYIMENDSYTSSCGMRSKTINKVFNESNRIFFL